MRALRVARVAFVRASWSRPPLRMASAAQLDAGPVADFKAATSSARRRASAAKSVSSLPTLVAPAALALARARASSRPDSVPVDGHDQTTSTLASEEEAKSELEVKDAGIIFERVWNNLVQKYGEKNLVFPRDIMWLAGAPGAGKGRMTPFISQIKGISAAPLEISHLLNSPEARKIKAEGKLVGDRQVVELLCEALLQPQYRQGVIVDGFPRTTVQALCINQLFDEMLRLKRHYEETPEYVGRFPRPIFHVTVLFIEEAESIKRQLARGKADAAHNRLVETTGAGVMREIRLTDTDPALAKKRYQQFRDEVYGSLQAIKEKFHFHFIDADGSPAEVEERIQRELRYQSQMELADATFERIKQIPLASEIIQHARMSLVERLDRYVERQSDLFDRVTEVLQREFVSILRRQALAGEAIIRSESPVFDEPGAIDMALDIISERGFTVVLDKQRVLIPHLIDEHHVIKMREKRVFEFHISFPKPQIRRG